MPKLSCGGHIGGEDVGCTRAEPERRLPLYFFQPSPVSCSER
jgi:hypothetical protein